MPWVPGLSLLSCCVFLQASRRFFPSWHPEHQSVVTLPDVALSSSLPRRSVTLFNRTWPVWLDKTSISALLSRTHFPTFLLPVHAFSYSKTPTGTFGRHAGVICHPGPGAGPSLSLTLPHPATISSILPSALSSPCTCLDPASAPSSSAQGGGGRRGNSGGESPQQSGVSGLILQGHGSAWDGTPALRP